MSCCLPHCPRACTFLNHIPVCIKNTQKVQQGIQLILKKKHPTHFSRMLSFSFWSASKMLFPWFAFAERGAQCEAKKKTSADMKDAAVGVRRSLTLRGDGLSCTSPSMMRRTASSMSPLAMDRALRASDRPHLGNISSRCCSWASHPPAGGCTCIVKR